MLKKTYLGVAALALLLMPQLAHSAVSKQPRTDLVIVHWTGRVEGDKTPPGTCCRKDLTQDLDKDMPYELSKGEVLHIGVRDQNPLLFTYKLNGVTKTKVPEFETAQKFADLVKKVAGELTPGVPPSAAGVREALAKQVGVENMKGAAKASREGDIAIITEAIWALQEAADKVTQIPKLVEKSSTGAAAAEEVRIEVGDWNVDGLISRVTKASEALRELKFKKRDELIKAEAGQSQGAELQQAINRLVEILVAEEDGFMLNKIIETLKVFSATASKINQPLELAVVEYSGTEISHVVVGIEPVEDSAKFAAKSKLKTGDFTFNVGPRTPIHYHFGAAAVYSFIELPDFGTKTENGKTTIVRKDDGKKVNGATGAMFLQIEPEAWTTDAFSGSILVGIGPQKDKLGFFLGGNFRLFDLVNFGLGAAYQQTKTLAGGLKVGDEITSADKLKTEDRYRTGLFVSLGFTIK